MRAALVALALFAGLLGPLAGCDEVPYVIDPFPVFIDLDAGVPTLAGCAPDLDGCQGGLRPLVLDTGSPVTVVDPGDLAAATDPSRARTSILMSSVISGKPVTRAEFKSVSALVRPMGELGLDGARVPAPAVILGADQLLSLSMRLEPQFRDRDGTHRPAVFFFPNLAGASDVLARACSAVMGLSRQGGGRAVLGDAEFSLPATRLVVGACLNLDAPPAAGMSARPTRSGSDALLVVATGLPVSLLAASTWQRLTGEVLDARTPFDGSLGLPGAGPGQAQQVWRRTLDRLAVVGEEDPRLGPCDEVYVSRIMSLGGYSEGQGGSPPCRNKARYCSAAAAFEVPGALAVAVVPDESPFIQALRNELRPRIADVDGALGMNALLGVVSDFDYPGGRLAFRCPDDATPEQCVLRPRFDADRRSVGASCRHPLTWTPTTTP